MNHLKPILSACQLLYVITSCAIIWAMSNHVSEIKKDRDEAFRGWNLATANLKCANDQAEEAVKLAKDIQAQALEVIDLVKDYKRANELGVSGSVWFTNRPPVWPLDLPPSGVWNGGAQ